MIGLSNSLNIFNLKQRGSRKIVEYHVCYQFLLVQNWYKALKYLPNRSCNSVYNGTIISLTLPTILAQINAHIFNYIYQKMVLGWIVPILF